MAEYQMCRNCIMDTSVPDIQFDADGVCNYCRLYAQVQRQYVHYDEAGQARLAKIVADIQRQGKRRDYDCVIGVSGGVDSTYVAYLVKKRFGLRPLAVHLDNGWDSELAVHNIEQTLKRLDIDLYTHVLDWEEFRDLQLAFLKSSIANAEIPTDHAITALLYRTAAKHGIAYIITGQNIVTEAIMPASWMYGSSDLRLIQAIHRRFGTIPLRTYPQMGPLRLAYYTLVKRIKAFRLLDYVAFDKASAKQFVIDELGWRDYGGKHYESIYTRFFQTFYLPQRFNIDKRRPHLSNLVLSGQMGRAQALEEIARPPAPASQIEEDVEYVVKKLGLSDKQFADLMAMPPKSHLDYPNAAFIRRDFGWLVRLARRLHYNGEN